MMNDPMKYNEKKHNTRMFTSNIFPRLLFLYVFTLSEDSPRSISSRAYLCMGILVRISMGMTVMLHDLVAQLLTHGYVVTGQHFHFFVVVSHVFVHEVLAVRNHDVHLVQRHTQVQSHHCELPVRYQVQNGSHYGEHHYDYHQRDNHCEFHECDAFLRVIDQVVPVLKRLQLIVVPQVPVAILYDHEHSLFILGRFEWFGLG